LVLLGRRLPWILLSTRRLPLGAYECAVHRSRRSWCHSTEVSFFGRDVVLGSVPRRLAILGGWRCKASLRGCVPWVDVVSRVSWGCWVEL
jgi:hypothetical protein